MADKRKLKPGHYLKGPEPYGCFNTGVAPVIARSKTAKKYTGYEYIVGRDLDVLNDMTGLLRDVIRGRKVKPKLYKTAGSAWRQFEKLCNAMIESIRQDQANHADLKKRAAGGDMAAVLGLSDY